MAFDQTTRNRLQRFVNSAREILSDEFTRQLQAVYGMDPKQGTVADISSLTHLNNSQRQTAHILRETLEHYLATTPGKSDKDRVKQVLSRIVREQAFTVLNRLAALRMAEARDFLLESVGKGQSSKGFQLYRQLAGTSHGETGDAYRNYLFSLFDEFSIDLAVLFDRYSTQGRLFPRESALLELLAEINHHEIEELWAEDETIGWIYQYFNSQEERKKMRAESQAPRNSRELAVRNQFFTPRYVVEFLTDNTLGRIWYEMTQGNTALIDSCSYLVRRPTEVFLKSGEQSPETDSVEGESLSQDELLKQAVYIPYRKLKDPRSIRMLDPACGSMHFGLYAFDLYEQIYVEAWQLEQELGPDAFQREANQQALQTSFANLDEFKAQIPKLIIENNIHGVDIDPRAVQIAGLSLWQRAQRAWQQQGVKPQQRPVIVKSNIVCAEPMPGDKDLLKEFTGKLHPPALGQLVEVIFDKMELAGEAGTLLKIEEEIQTAIDKARDQWETKKGSDSIGDLFQDELEAATPQHELGFDLYGIDNETFWDDAEQLILKALSDYADRAEFDTDQKRLFAEDAAKGFAFIDLCRKRFDVVLMNPPFGDASKKLHSTFNMKFPGWNYNLLCAFTLWAIKKSSFIGSITDRSYMLKTSFKDYREQLLRNDQVSLITDLGWNVLDANVEVNIQVYSENNNEIGFLDLSFAKDKENALIESVLKSKEAIGFKYLSSASLRKLPDSIFSYNVPGWQLDALENGSSVVNILAEAKSGLKPGKVEQFVRLAWEEPVDRGTKKKWNYYQNGGEYSPYFYSTYLVILYEKDWKQMRLVPSSRITGIEDYFNPGITYGKRTDFIYGYPMPSGQIFSNEGMAVFPANESKLWSTLAFINSSSTQYMMNHLAGQHKAHSYFNKIHLINSDFPQIITKKAKNIVSVLYGLDRYVETSLNYQVPPCLEESNVSTLDDIEIWIHEIKSKLDNAISDYYEIDEEIALFLNNKSPQEYNLPNWELLIFRSNLDLSYVLKALLSYAFGVSIGNLTNVKFKKLSDLSPNEVFNDLSDKSPLTRSMDSPISSNCIVEIDLDDKTSSFDNLILTIKKYAPVFLEMSPEYLNKNCGTESLLSFYSTSKGFFDFHKNLYSRGRREAPIYWPLQTTSGSYTLWIYYHRLNEQTLYTCINDFVEPKLAIATADLNSLRSQSARSTEEEKELAQLTDLEAELKDFRDELLRLARFWKPNLNDGVQITAAPLWKLFQHKAWQKKLKETWNKLEEGDYDWAHLAGSIWPERVLRKCHQDRSLAIAHDVEDIFWHEVEIPIMRGKKPTGNTKIEWQPKNLTDTELTALIKQTVIGSK